MLEDSDLDAELIRAQLALVDSRIDIRRATGKDDYIRALAEARFDLILSDYSLPSFDGTTALAIARDLAPETPFIFVSGVLGEEFAIESLKEGATDYVLKQRLKRLPSAVQRALAEARERSERRQAEESLQLLVAELSHRVKNTLATVVSMARLTIKRSNTLEEFEAAFMDRLQALSEAHSLIFQANWGETELTRVVDQALRPFRARADGRFRISGEPVALEPKPALALTLMLHELATNAAKYGALASPEGEVDLAWRLDDDADQRLTLRWKETGGPAVVAPERKGFGHQLIEKSSRLELDGEARIDFRPDGVEAEISFPLAADSATFRSPL